VFINNLLEGSEGSTLPIPKFAMDTILSYMGLLSTEHLPKIRHKAILPYPSRVSNWQFFQDISSSELS